MGGNVAWTIRRDDGTEYRMDRWTNLFPDITTGDAFLAGDPDALTDVIGSWLDMKADWDANKETGAFQHDMTEVYAPYPFGLRPSEYGFIVTDFVTKTIVSCQHYTTIGRKFVFPWMRSNWRHPMQDIFDQFDDEAMAEYRRRRAAEDVAKTQELRDLHESGRLLYTSVWDKETGWRDVYCEGLTFDEVVVTATQGDVLGDVVFKLPEPWVVCTFDSDTPEGRRAAFEKVKALDFALAEDETNDFEVWFAECNDDDV